jgi:DNA-binding XRE family transcriptional regulator
MTTLEEKLNQLPPDRRAKIQARADQLLAEEMSLRDLRLARKLTQEKMAELLKIRQEGVSRIEKRSDLHPQTSHPGDGRRTTFSRRISRSPPRHPVWLSSNGRRP